MHHEDERAGSSEVVLIFRLVLDGNARLRRGELVGADAMRQARFEVLTGSADSLSKWLERQRLDSNPNDEPM